MQVASDGVEVRGESVCGDNMGGVGTRFDISVAR